MPAKCKLIHGHAIKTKMAHFGAQLSKIRPLENIQFKNFVLSYRYLMNIDRNDRPLLRFIFKNRLRASGEV